MGSVRVGLVIAAILGLADVAALATGDGEFPPVWVAVVAVILGLITLVGVFLGWRGSRNGIGVVILSRALSALSALPAFFIEDVPGGAQVVALVFILVTAVVIALLLPAWRRR